MENDSRLTENEIPKDEVKTKKLKDAKKQLFERFNTAKNARIKRNLSIFLEKYARPVLYGFVIVLMVAVCIVTLVNKKRSKLDSGTIMSMTEVASESKAFAGKSFNAEILTYDDMLMMESDSNDEMTDIDRQRVEMALSLANSASGETGKSQSVTLNERAEVVGVIEETTQAATTESAYSSSTVTTTTTSVAASPVSAPVYATADGNYQYLGEFLLTAYCACPICCGAWSNIENPTTASGAIASANHTIAVDTSVIAFGTEVLINGQVYVAEDRGSAINGNHIDIFFATHQEATNFGKQTASVYVKIAN